MASASLDQSVRIWDIGGTTCTFVVTTVTLQYESKIHVHVNVVEIQPYSIE